MPKIAEAKVAGKAVSELTIHLPKAVALYLGVKIGDSVDFHAEPFEGSEPTPQVLVTRRPKK